jgi:hypothetical protein
MEGTTWHIFGGIESALSGLLLVPFGGRGRNA